MVSFPSLTVASDRLRRKWIRRKSGRAKASPARTPARDVPTVTKIPTAANIIIKTTTVTRHVSYVNISEEDADASEEDNTSHGSRSRRHSDTVVSEGADTVVSEGADTVVGASEGATYQDLPTELRIEIWAMVLVDDEYTSLIWAVQKAVEWPAIFAFPVGNHSNWVADATIYTERRRAPINTLLHLDEAAKHAVYRRFKPVPAGLSWRCGKNELSRPHLQSCPVPRNGQWCEWECPMEQAAGCQCDIVWVDPVRDVFVLPGIVASCIYKTRFLSTEERRKSCRLHGGVRFGGLDVIQNVLISSEAFMNRIVDGKMALLRYAPPDQWNSPLWPLPRDAVAANRDALLRLPSLKFVFLLVNAGMWGHNFMRSRWTYAVSARLHLDNGEAGNSPRNWLLGMKLTDPMAVTRSDKKVLLEDFAECWAPFAAKGVAYQCMLWEKNNVDTLEITRALPGVNKT